MLTRPVQHPTDTTQGDLIGNFDKLVSHIDWHVTGIDNSQEWERQWNCILGLTLTNQVVKLSKREDKRKQSF